MERDIPRQHVHRWAADMQQGLGGEGWGAALLSHAGQIARISSGGTYVCSVGRGWPPPVPWGVLLGGVRISLEEMHSVGFGRDLGLGGGYSEERLFSSLVFSTFLGFLPDY